MIVQQNIILFRLLLVFTSEFLDDYRAHPGTSPFKGFIEMNIGYGQRKIM